MKRPLFFWLCVLIFLFSSCAKMPYQVWNAKLTSEENSLVAQQEISKETSLEDINLFNGVFNVTKSKEKEPYPEIKKINSAIVSLNDKIQDSTSERLIFSENFRNKYFEKPLKTMGPEWSNFMKVMDDLKAQNKGNESLLSKLNELDQDFDSICVSSKIRAVPMAEYEVLIADKLTSLETRLASAKQEFNTFKKGITKQEDMKEGLFSINRMNQKIRQIESEIQQFSNLYSRINSTRAEAMLYEGPGVEPIAEIKLISQKEMKIEGFINELEKLISGYK